MKTKIGSLFITATVLISLSACSYVKSLFPDKEKDYQYTTEIPPLILPDDLKNNQARSAPSLPTSTTTPSGIADDAAPPVAVNAPVEKAAAPTIKESATTVPGPTASPEGGPVVPDTEITIQRVKIDNGENRLHINVPFTKAWRIVGKALTRKSIEVTERNQETKLFTVQYDPDEKKAEDESYWDEVVFLFKGIQNNEKTYLLKLEENNQQTDIIVVNEDQQPLSDAASFKLLTLIEETIKADLAHK